MNTFVRGIAAATFAVSLLAGVPTSQAAYTDLAKYTQDLRKAGNDLKARLELHLQFLHDKHAEAVAQKNEAMLSKGLKQMLNTAIHDFYALQKDPSADAEDTRRIGRELEKLRVAIVAGPEEVRKATLNEPPPKDVYAGKDKAELKSLVAARWKERYPGEDVVAIRFDKESWERVKNRNWVENGKYWQNVDVSTLTVRVIVRKDAETATIHGIYVQRDNDNPGKGAEVGRKGTFAPRDVLLALVN